MPTVSHSWKPSVPIRLVGTWAVMQTSGMESSSASVRLDRRYLLDPTPPVSRTAPRFEELPAKWLRVAYALLVLLGPLGAHRCYLGRHESATAMLALAAPQRS